MTTLYYISNNHSFDSNTAVERITYYTDLTGISVTEENSNLIVTSNEALSKVEIINIDAALSSLGYLRP